MNTFKKICVVVCSTLAFGGLTLGLSKAMNSGIFTVQAVLISSNIEDPPLSIDTIRRLAAVPVGKASLFDLDLHTIEKNLLTHEWIEHVDLQKIPLHTLSITVTFREPIAIFQISQDTLAYIDAEGKTFGSVDLLHAQDLPLFSGFSPQDHAAIKKAINLITKWGNSKLNQIAPISTVRWDEDRGFRTLITYSLNIGHMATVHSMIDLGQYFGWDEINDDNFDLQLNHLSGVFHYLSRNSIAAHHVWANTGKKIVVKTTAGS